MRVATWVCWALVVSIGSACGGSTSGTGTEGLSGTGGSSSSSGGGSVNDCHNTVGGCAAPPAHQGSASIHFQAPSMEATAAGKQCPAGVHFADAPTADTADQRTAGSSRPSDTVVDGENSRSFQCSVVPNGDKFAVSASMSVPAFDKDHLPLPVPTQIRLQTTIAQDESGAPGSLSAGDDATAGAFYESGACTFSVKADAHNTKLAIDPGKAWGSVTCSSFSDPADPSSSCTVDVGYFILENCDQ